MKKNICRKLFIISLLSLSAISCDKKIKELEDLHQETFFEWKVNGSTYTTKNAVAVKTPDGKVVITAFTDVEHVVAIVMNTGGKKNFTFGDEETEGKAKLSIANGQLDGYTSRYEECETEEYKYTVEQLKITAFGDPGYYVEGSFTGTLYQQAPNCVGPVTPKEATVKFRILRSPDGQAQLH